jgi:nucleoside-diphosphate-sugar epimerase
MAATILITGADGFISSHTTLFFESLGARVVPVDVTPRSDDLSLLPVATPTRRLDVTDAAAFREVCVKEQVTHIVHAAHPPRQENPAVLQFALQAMRNILEAATAGGVERVVFLSSGAVYGPTKRGDGRPIREDDPIPIYPTFLYRSAKILAEWLGDSYAHHHGVGFVALRLSAVYGPGQPHGLGLAIKEGLLGRTCRPYLIRVPDDPVFVTDVAEAVRLACLGERPPSRSYNIAVGRPYVEADLEQAIRRQLPRLSFEIGQPPDHTTVNRYRQRDILDVTLARQELGFVPKFDLEHGIAAIGEWVERNINRLGGNREERR